MTTRPHLRTAPAVKIGPPRPVHRGPNVVAMARSVPNGIPAAKAKPGDWVPVRVELIAVTGSTRELALSLVDDTGRVIKQQEDTTAVLDRADVEALRDALTEWLARGGL